MAGAGRKQFQVNEVLSANDVNTYLMDQAVMRFADESARSSAIGTPTEGMVSYLDDTNQLDFYDGSQWQVLSTGGDITASAAELNILDGVTATTGDLNLLDGVTATTAELNFVDGVTSNVQTQLDDKQDDVISAEGDLVIGDSSGDASKISIGSADQVLTSNGTTAVWADASGGGGGGGSVLDKADYFSVIFNKTGNGTAEIKAGTNTTVNGATVEFATDTAITMPSLTAGTDYFVYAIDDGTAEAVAATGTWPTPVASPPANSRLIGGFHYAPGGNATAQSGGDTTAQINEYSFWDLKFRPSATDPRGMTLVSGAFWVDIYLLNTDPQTNGTSKYNVRIADGNDEAIVPDAFGGNGSTTYSGMTWWNTAEALSAFGKRSISYREASVAFYGTTEESSAGSDPVDTILRADYTSKWGVMLSTGNMRQWGDDFGGGAGPSSYEAITGGRGSVYLQANAVDLGGAWLNGSVSGSRFAFWGASPSFSTSTVGGRGACDHLLLV